MESIIAILLSGASVLYVSLLNRIFRLKVNKTKFPAIEGTRGYLSLIVFMHHACIWFFYLRTGKWEAPPVHLFSYFRQTGVAFFFMITAFFFTGKLMEKGMISWPAFFLKRFFRLFSLYTFSVLLLLLTVLLLSGF